LETFRCPGGALCLDFCNTGQGLNPHWVREGQGKNSQSEEWVPTFTDLVDWLNTARAIDARQASWLGAASERSPEAAVKVWRRAIELREALTRLLLARTEGRKHEAPDLKVIDTEYARTALFARLEATSEGFAWNVEPEALDAALRPIVESAVALLTSPKLARLRRCGNSTCYWLFLDETKNCSRRWCEMASCGNVMKVRRHRARKLAT
jgi:predicted RNA-binding Zn ribbon-like protein